MKQNMPYIRLSTVAGILLFGMAATSAALEPAVSDIVVNVTNAMVPDAGYQVVVTQTVEPPVAKEVTRMTVAPVEINQFVLRYDVVTGVSTGSALLQPAIQDSTAQSLMESQPAASPLTVPLAPVRLRFDIRKILAHIQAMNSVRIESESYNGKAAWKVSAQNDDGKQGLTYVLHVDAEQWTVGRLEVKAGIYEFTDSVFSYGLVGTKFMPLMMATTFASDGTRVVQEYGAYLLDK